METVKKASRAYNKPNGTRRVSARQVNGNLLSQEAQTKWSREKVWDVAWFNFRTEKWELEGQEKTYRQAYARALHQSNAYPYSKIGVVLVPALIRKLKKNAVSA